MKEMFTLQQQIADEAARTDIECKALAVPTTYPHPVYDPRRIELLIDDEELVAAWRADVERAVRYLELRGLLVRPIPDDRTFVSFA